MKLKDTYLAMSDYTSTNISKSLQGLKAEDFLDPSTIADPLRSICEFYHRRKLMEIDRCIPMMLNEGLIAFMRPDRQGFPSTMINTIPAVNAVHPKSKKVITVLESRGSIKVVLDKSTAERKNVYEVKDQWSLLNDLIYGAMMYTLNKVPIDFNSSANHKLAKSAGTAFALMIQRVFDSIFSLGSTTDAMKLSMVTHAACEWFYGNVLDMEDTDAIMTLARRTVFDISLKGWTVVPPSYDRSLQPMLHNTDFKGMCELIPKITKINIDIKMSKFIATTASLFGAAIPNSLEYFPFFAGHICGVETRDINSGVKHKSLKDAFKGQPEIGKFREGMMAHLNKNGYQLIEKFNQGS